MNLLQELDDAKDTIRRLERRITDLEGAAIVANNARDAALAELATVTEHHDAVVALVRPDLTHAKPDPEVKKAHTALQKAMDASHLALIPEKKP